jgi:hypothetical protein
MLTTRAAHLNNREYMPQISSTIQRKITIETARSIYGMRRTSCWARYSLSARTDGGRKFISPQTAAGTIMASSRRPKKGIVSGIRSIGLIRYKSAASMSPFTSLGVAGLRIASSMMIRSFRKNFKNAHTLRIILPPPSICYIYYTVFYHIFAGNKKSSQPI